jgi:hypothetical protein
MPFHHEQNQPAHLDAPLRELTQLVEIYATKQALPTTVVAALKDISSTMEEIDLCQREGHGPDHRDIPWRVAHLMLLCVCIERAGLRAGSAQSLAAHFLEHIGVSLACAIELALVRLRSLLGEKDIVHVDTYVLVPMMKRHLHR